MFLVVFAKGSEGNGNLSQEAMSGTERTVLDDVGKFNVKLDTLQTILDKLSEKRGLPMVGRAEYREETTRKVIDFYVDMREHFLRRSYNANNDASRQKARRKSAKLTLIFLGRSHERLNGQPYFKLDARSL